MSFKKVCIFCGLKAAELLGVFLAYIALVTAGTMFYNFALVPITKDAKVASLEFFTLDSIGAIIIGTIGLFIVGMLLCAVGWLTIKLVEFCIYVYHANMHWTNNIAHNLDERKRKKKKKNEVVKIITGGGFHGQ